MTPHCPQPFHMVASRGVVGETFEVVENIASSHLPQSPKQVPRVVQHDARVAPLADQVGDEVSHAAIAVGKWPGVVVVPVVGVLKHILQRPNQFP